MPDARARSIDTVERINHKCVSGGRVRHRSPDPPNLQTLDNRKARMLPNSALQVRTARQPD